MAGVAIQVFIMTGGRFTFMTTPVTAGYMVESSGFQG
jgi:hypothetical protein